MLQLALIAALTLGVAAAGVVREPECPDRTEDARRKRLDEIRGNLKKAKTALV